MVVAAKMMNLSESMKIDDLCSDNAMTKAGTESPPPLITTKIPRFNLQVDLPPGFTVAYDPKYSAKVDISNGDTKLILALDLYGFDGNSPEDYIKFHKNSNLRDIKIEMLSDGWILTDVEDFIGDNAYYGVHSKRQIGADKYVCGILSENKEGQTDALKICKSVRP